jgi:hypothetical protein
MAICLLQDIIDPFSNYIREMEIVRKNVCDAIIYDAYANMLLTLIKIVTQHTERGQDYTRNLQEAYAGMKKVRMIWCWPLLEIAAC